MNPSYLFWIIHFCFAMLYGETFPVEEFHMNNGADRILIEENEDYRLTEMIRYQDFNQDGHSEEISRVIYIEYKPYWDVHDTNDEG